MRKSAIPGDPDYDSEVWRYRVFLDGVEIFNCHTVDDEKGVCYCYEHNYDPSSAPEVCHNVKTVERHGAVKLVKTDNDHYR